MNLLNRCNYSDRKLALLCAKCVRTAAQTIAVIISDTPGFKDDIKINMALNRLAQRFRVSGGFLNEPEVRKFVTLLKCLILVWTLREHLRMN